MTLIKPLLVIDGDFFAHRAYHAVPKTIRRAGNKGAGAIVGFANFLLRLYESEQPRAVLVGWDTLDAPTYSSAGIAGSKTILASRGCLGPRLAGQQASPKDLAA